MKFGTIFSITLLVQLVVSVELDINDKDSICEAAKSVVQGELNYYEGTKYGGTVGMFSNPYYWWHAGEAFGGLVDYYTFCESDNKTLEKLIYNGMYHQAGDDYNYIPSNQSMTEGNDDQGVWGMAVMQAAERNFTDPKDHSWLEMTQAIYNTMNSRWDTKHCNGGLRWQIFTWNSGYDYKNSIANGCLFHIAARLARFTDNKTYAKVAEKVWDWMEDVGFATYVDDELVVYDGAKIGGNCTDLTKSKWSYTYGIFLSGCAYMYNYTNDNTWLDRVDEILRSSDFFFKDGYMFEHTCGGGSDCNNDERTFRSLFSRCLGLTSILAPSTKDTISTWIDTSAQGAASSCSGGTDGITCGEDWSKGSWDGVYGLGEQMSALEVMMALIVKTPLTADTGGSSKSNVNAGTNTGSEENKNEIKVTSQDKAGAGVLTAVVLLIITGGSIWMLF
ncbi:mannan endo-1,6-alpha-mannosidase DCW1 precursor [Hyphopichia burtonii NRRL Y-1933]|uniref:Mannan endo-1,6-alpha-mannosidase n=1 Tax=Hyphopichia burtonii NRRL Y-1933 TaxID=984485 RepID=A0A1E4RN89_9ASCO|nr:mannan endo-1,6-alpha-mannosidase DCW1 precursor [Hyphopichia burtonii NRRL Y-1933]ODV68719.1 mannan endo-1,6-alpha-mannosidase DCW1 precursor [Hyphopichia burtonii NRRL Y-1933]